MTAKSSKSKSHLSESQKTILSTKESMDKCKRDSLKAVESLLENSVSVSELVKTCESLCQADYADVIEERNILNLCGYPLCDTIIKIPAEKYHISYRLNKVYDITERKCFCSNECYKASKYLQVQLSVEPSWINVESKNVNVLSKDLNRGAFGDEVIMTSPLSKADAHSKQVSSQESTPHVDFDDVLQDELGESQFQNLEVTEKWEESDANYYESVALEEDDGGDYDYASAPPSDLRPPHIPDELPTFHNTEPEKPLTAARAKETKKCPMLIDAIPIKMHRPVMLMKKAVTPELAKKALKKWMTVNALKFLFGEDFIRNFQLELHREELAIEECTNMQIMQEGYIKLCEDLHNLDILDQADDLKILNEAKKEAAKGSENIEENTNVKNNTENQEGSQKKKRQKKKKKVSFSADTKGGKTEPILEDNTRTECVLPNVDSLSQSSLRLQIVRGRLKVAFCSLLPVVGLHYSSISTDLKPLLTTLQFSANNITFKPDEWKLLALVFFRMLKARSSEHQEHFCEILKKSQFAEYISVSDIEDVIDYISNPKNYL